ncbi:MAG: TRAP transporter small permease subunit, partial [Parafilimonas terrae]|nr:TRAP transporter small permease subunit [Parafilimonas terrae]
MAIDIAAAAAAGLVDGPPVRARGWLKSLDSAIGWLVEIPAALLVLAEIGVLLSGVVSRYVFHEPLIWSDELAGILFLWLAMLGAVVAFRRAEHMRMTALVAMGGPRTRAFLETLALVAGLVFVSLVLHPAYEFASEETFVQTPALELNNAWRAAALPVGFGLMLIIALIRLAETADWKVTLAALATGVAIAGGLVVVQPLLAGLGNLNLLLFFVLGVGLLVFSGVPIAFAFGLSTFAYVTLTTHAPSMVVVGRMDEGMSHLILLAVPLFVFLGLLIEMTGMARAMVGFLASLLGHVRGGLHYVLVGAMYLVSGISGSKAADMAAVAPV